MVKKGKRVKERVNIGVTEEVKQYYMDKADDIGCSMSIAMFMALYQQMDMEKGMKALGQGDMAELLTKINHKLSEIEE